MDLGEPGMEDTLAALDSVGIAHTSRYGDIGWLERDGVKIAVIGAHSGSCCLNVNRLEEVQGAIVQADREADIVIFSFHGGAEGRRAIHVPRTMERFYGENRGNLREFTHLVVDATDSVSTLGDQVRSNPPRPLAWP